MLVLELEVPAEADVDVVLAHQRDLRPHNVTEPVPQGTSLALGILGDTGRQSQGSSPDRHRVACCSIPLANNMAP